MVMDQHPLTSFRMCCLFVFSFVILITDGSQILSVAKASLRHGLFLPSGSRGLASQVFALLSPPSEKLLFWISSRCDK